MALATSITVNLGAKQSATLDLGASVANITKNFALTLTSGTAAGQADKIFADTRTLAASTNEDLDLAGTLTDPSGATVVFAKVKAILICAASGNTNNVVVGGAASNAFSSMFGDATDKVVIRPGGHVSLSVGSGDLNAYAVTAGTGDLLRVANSGAGTSVTYDIIVIGTSA
jgi:hypothetical protein